MQVIYTQEIEKDLSGIILAKDNYRTHHQEEWDDFSYRVKFKIYYKSSKKEKEVLLGCIRVLIENIKKTSTYFTEKGKKINEKNYDITSLFDENVVSLPLEIDFYKKVRTVLVENGEQDKITSFLRSIRDASYFSAEKHLFSKFQGYYETIMREGSTTEAVMEKGFSVSQGRYIIKKKFDVCIPLGSERFDDLDLSFDLEKKEGARNINLLIGRNGVGKTFIIDQIIKTILGISENKIEYPYFNKVVVSAFSPFENFPISSDISDLYKDKHSIEASKLKKENKKKRLIVNNYCYIGFRNQDKTFDKSYPKYKSVKSIFNIIKYDNENKWWSEIVKKEILFETLKLSINFDSLCVKDKNNNLIDLKDIDTIDYRSINIKEGLFFLKNSNLVKLSSGQEIYTYLIPQLIDEIENETLLLIDEPELYLHPGIELGLIKMIKELLIIFKSFAVIATHSSIISREVDRHAVKVLRRSDDYTTITLPNIQTYGADLETIISEVFEDNLEIKIFEEAIDKLINDEETNLENINSEFGVSGEIYYLSKNIDENLEFED